MGQEKHRGHSTICENARDVLRAEAMEVGLKELYGQPIPQDWRESVRVDWNQKDDAKEKAT